MLANVQISILFSFPTSCKHSSACYSATCVDKPLHVYASLVSIIQKPVHFPVSHLTSLVQCELAEGPSPQSHLEVVVEGGQLLSQVVSIETSLARWCPQGPSQLRGITRRLSELDIVNLEPRTSFPMVSE